MTKENTEKKREIAKIVARNPKIAAVVGCALKDAAKYGKRQKSYDPELIDPDVIPSCVVKFLSKEKNFLEFTKLVREEIIAILEKEDVNSESIIDYAVFFQLSDLADVHSKQYKNLYKLLMVLCLEQQAKYEMAIKVVSCNDDIEKIVKLHEKVVNQLINPERIDSLFAEEVNWD